MDDEHVDMRVAWIGLDELPIHMANQFVSQFQPDSFVISIGSLSPPMLLGSQEEQMEQARALGYAAVKPVVRIGLTPQRMGELVRVLTDSLEKYEAAIGQEGGSR